jgi:hypothetical protein
MTEIKNLNQDEIQMIRKKMTAAVNYPHEWEFSRVTIKTMAGYLQTVHPELHVELDGTSCSKDSYSRSGKIRFPGAREYSGYRLKVWSSLAYAKERHFRYPDIVNHDTTETYRQNWEVAKAIIQYEEKKGEAKQNGNI